MSNYARTHARRKSPVESDDEKSRLAMQSSTRDPAGSDGATSPANAAHNDPGYNFGQIDVQPAPAVAPQMKLRVSQPGDAHEQEADQVADTVMRMPTAEAAAPGETSATHAMAGQSGGSRRGDSWQRRPAARCRDTRLHGAALRPRLRPCARPYRRAGGAGGVGLSGAGVYRRQRYRLWRAGVRARDECGAAASGARADPRRPAGER